jgi:branched-chain amino acid transport system permease protein
MIFGIILVLMMIFRPQGILPARRRQREIEAVEAEAATTDAAADRPGLGTQDPR